MEAEAEGRVKSLPYKVRSVSRESAAQKAAHVLDPDLRAHWSTSTNTKEWLVLELEESCLLSHIRIHNKSVLEWEISIGLRFKLTFLPLNQKDVHRTQLASGLNNEWDTLCRVIKASAGLVARSSKSLIARIADRIFPGFRAGPSDFVTNRNCLASPDTYLKVRPRCEAPRRDVTYHVGYQPCCFVRISCLRGNPIAIFHIQLMGIPVPSLEPELQPVVDHILPHVIAHIQEPHDIYIQLLQEIASRLSRFLSQLEGELAVGTDSMESSIRFFAMLVGPLYPILAVLGRRENDKAATAGPEAEATKSNLPTVFTVSSNFQAPPKRVRSPGLSPRPAGLGLALRPDAALLLMRAAYKDSCLGNLCRKVGRLLYKLNGPSFSGENLLSVNDSSATTAGLMGAGVEEGAGDSEAVASPAFVSDYSSIFGEDYRILHDDGVEISHVGILDVAAVEEGLLHVLYACASQPIISRRLADSKSDLIPVLPLLQAMLPALRPIPSTSSDADHVDETFWQWQASIVQRVVTQVVALSTSPSYRPLLDSCAGYLSSYSPAQEKAACVLIDLCAGPLAPWLPMVVAKIDLAMELLEDLLGIIQAGHGASAYGHATLVYLILALSGRVDGVLAQYKDVKYHVLFLVEILEPFLIPAITPVKSTIAFGDVSAVLDVKQEQACAIALDLLHTAIQKPAVLPALEAEWRRGHVTPSVLLSILAPHMPQPPGIDQGSTLSRGTIPESVPVEDENGPPSSDFLHKSGSTYDEMIINGDVATEGSSKTDISDNPDLLFAPAELKNLILPTLTSQFEGTSPDTQKATSLARKSNGNALNFISSPIGSKVILDPANAEEYSNLRVEYLQLVNSQERELRALEFTRFATELHSRRDVSKESHEAAIDALLLAAECHINPFFMVPTAEYQQQLARFDTLLELPYPTDNACTGKKISRRSKEGLEKVFWLEDERDKAVLCILLEAAEWDSDADQTLGEAVTESGDNLESSCRVQIFPEDSQSKDALTLIRNHQDLLCTFFVRQLQGKKCNMYEVLLQGLLLILNSATRLSTPPVQIINVILQCAEHINNSLIVFYSQIKEGTGQPEPAWVYSIRRQWALLCRLVFAASGGRSIIEDRYLRISEGSLLQTALIPAQAWMAQISIFPFSAFPLVRYIGWSALSRYANYYKEAGLLLVSDVEQLTSLLIIFSDELYSVIGWKLKKTKEGDARMEDASKVAAGTAWSDSRTFVEDQVGHFDPGGLVKALYPELDLLFPKLRSQFSEFAEIMLESICQLLRALPSSSIPDLLSWYSEICSHPFPTSITRYPVANVKYIVLYLLEVIVVEHMEAIVPELPRLLKVLLSLCSSTYSDVPLLESVLAVLKPIISHATATAASIEDYAQEYNPGISFESLCFDAMLDHLKAGPSTKHQDSGESKSALVLFLAGSLLSDLSVSRRNALITYFICWANFTVRNSTMTYYNYLRAFEKVLEECFLLLQWLTGEPNGQVFEVKPAIQKTKTQALYALTTPSYPPLTPRLGSIPPGLELGLDYEESELEHSVLENEGAAGSLKTQDDSEVVTEHMAQDEQVSVDDGTTSLDLEVRLNPFGSSIMIEEFKEKCTELVEALSPALEASCKIHPQLTFKVAHLAAKCLFYSGFQEHALSQSIAHEGRSKRSSGEVIGCQMENDPEMTSHPIEVLATRVLKLQEAHCWQVASVTMDYLLCLLSASFPSQALSSICAVLQYQCSHAPRVAWRLLTSKWLLKVLPLTATDALSSASAPLIGLLCVMLDHSEPEQRLGALQQLGKLVKNELDWTSEIGPDEVLSRGWVKEPNLIGLARALVASTWEKVATAAACDPLLGLRKEAMELLLKFVPLANPIQLQSFFKSSYSVLPTLTSSGVSVKSGPLTRLALMVLSRSCLYASEADVSMIPSRVWDTIEVMGNAKTGGVFAQPERALCQALLQLREHGEAAKESIMNTLSGNMEKMSSNSDFTPVREAVLEVLARLCAVWSREDSLTSAAEDLSKELEEAEIELELVNQERLIQRAEGIVSPREQVVSNRSTVVSGPLPMDTKERLKQLKKLTLAEISTLLLEHRERTNMKAAIAVRREKQRIAWCNRQLALEKAAFREMELLQELDRERATEAELEIERQRTLEKERAKTRELRHTLEVEVERRSQRDFQRELEQRESGAVRCSRRGEFSSSNTPSSRPRERYRERERESGRALQEGSSRLSAAGGSGDRESVGTPPATPTAAGAPGGTSSTVAASTGTGASSRCYNSGFTHGGRDRDERGFYDNSSAEGNGIRQGETGEGIHFGDGDGGGSGLDGGSTNNLASSQRQGGPRTSRPRQIAERRERDGRREGKWERKQT